LIRVAFFFSVVVVIGIFFFVNDEALLVVDAVAFSAVLYNNFLIKIN
jgi:hypothetical protein